MWVLPRTGVVSPAFRRQYAGRRTRGIVHEVMDERLAVDCICDGLAHANIFQNRIAEIEGHIAQPRAGMANEFQARLTLESGLHVRGESIDLQIRAALTQFKSAGGRVGDDHKTDALNLCPVAPIIIVALDDDFFILLGAHEAEGAGADGVAAHFESTAIGHDTHSWRC